MNLPLSNIDGGFLLHSGMLALSVKRQSRVILLLRAKPWVCLLLTGPDWVGTPSKIVEG